MIISPIVGAAYEGTVKPKAVTRDAAMMPTSNERALTLKPATQNVLTEAAVLSKSMQYMLAS